MSEDEFWESTLRKICALLDVHSRVNSTNDSKTSNGKKETKGETITLKCVD